jgi:heptosyltransferase I
VNSETLQSRDFRRILLVQLSAFGDVIHSIPLLNQLRQRYPAARIDWLTKPVIGELIQHHPAINRVIPFHDEAWRRPLRGGSDALRKFWRLGRELRAGRYDLVVDLHGQIRSAACAWFAGAPVRIGFDRPNPEVNAASPRKLPETAYRHGWNGARECAWLGYTHRVALETLDVHAVDRNLRLGLPLGLAPQPVDFSFPIPDAAGARADEILSEYGIGENAEFVLLAPSTVWDTKQWKTEGFAAVARYFLDKEMPVVLIGAGKDSETCRAVARDAPGVADLCGRTSLSELAALVRRAALVVANDSGPMHLAVALGRPTVSVFGPTDPLWIGPYRQPSAVVSAGLACSPCYLRQLRRCPNDHACMTGIAPAAVIAQAERALGGAAGPSTPMIAGAGLAG